MTEPSTCGEGLAEHAVLHTHLAALLGAVAANLELHLTALDPADDASRPEYDAYTGLARKHRELEDHHRVLTERMAACRDLPMANHDMEVLAGPDSLAAFRELIDRQDALVELLTGWAARDRAMLDAADGAGG